MLHFVFKVGPQKERVTASMHIKVHIEYLGLYVQNKYFFTIDYARQASMSSVNTALL